MVKVELLQENNLSKEQIMRDNNEKAVVASGTSTGVIAAEVVDAEVVEKLEPIYVSASLQFIIPTNDESMHLMHKELLKVQQTLMTHTEKLDTICQRILTDIDSINTVDLLLEIRDKINKKLTKQISFDSKYMKTSDAAAYISVDPSFLTKRQGKVLKLGKHFFKPEGESIVRWNITALEKWIISRKEDTDVIDNKLDSLLKRR